VAKTLSCAVQYPIHGNTLPHHSCPKSPNGVSCGYVPSMHPSTPVRVVFRCLARTAHRMWHRKSDGWNEQSIYPHCALHITHVYFIGVDFDVVHVKYPYTAVVPLQRDIRAMYLAQPRMVPQPDAGTGRGHPEGPAAAAAPTAIKMNDGRLLSLRKSFTTVELKNIIQHQDFCPDMPVGPGAWTDHMADMLLTPDTDPEFALHIKVERTRPWTGIGEWRHVTTDEVSGDFKQLLPAGFEHAALPFTWLTTMEGAGEYMTEGGWRCTPRVRLGVLKVNSLRELRELLGLIAPGAADDFADIAPLLGQDKFVGLVALTCKYNYMLTERTAGGGLPEGGATGTGIDHVLTSYHPPVARDANHQFSVAPIGVYEPGRRPAAAAAAAPAAAAPAQSSASLKRARKAAQQREAAANPPPGPPGGPDVALARFSGHVLRVCREYAKYSRVARAAYYRTNQWTICGNFVGIWQAAALGSPAPLDQRWVLQLGPAMRNMRPEAQAPGTITQDAAMAETAVSTLGVAYRIHQAHLEREREAAAEERSTTGRGHPEGGAASYASASSDVPYAGGDHSWLGKAASAASADHPRDRSRSQNKIGTASRRATAPRTPTKAQPAASSAPAAREGGHPDPGTPPAADDDPNEQPVPPPPPQPQSAPPVLLQPKRSSSAPSLHQTLSARQVARIAYKTDRGEDTGGQVIGSGSLKDVHVILTDSRDGTVAADVTLADGTTHRVYRADVEVVPPDQQDLWANYRPELLERPSQGAPRLRSPQRAPLRLRSRERDVRTRSQAAVRRGRSPKSRERSRDRPSVPNAVPVPDGEYAWGTVRTSRDRPFNPVDHYWKKDTDDETEEIPHDPKRAVYESDWEREYTDQCAEEIWGPAENKGEEVAKMPADFGLRRNVTMPEAAYITQAIQWHEKRNYCPKQGGLVAVVVPGEVDTTELTTYKNRAKIADSADGHELHEQMRLRPHLEARTLAWDREAMKHAKYFITNAKKWYEHHQDWMPNFVRPAEVNPDFAHLVWPPNRKWKDHRNWWAGRGHPERPRERWLPPVPRGQLLSPIPKIPTIGGLRIGRVANRQYIAKCTVYESKAAEDYDTMMTSAFHSDEIDKHDDRQLSPHDSDSECLYNPLSFRGSDTVYHDDGTAHFVPLFAANLDARRLPAKDVIKAVYARYLHDKDQPRTSIAQLRQRRADSLQARAVPLQARQLRGRGRSPVRSKRGPATGRGHPERCQAAAAPVEPATPFAEGTLLANTADPNAEFTTEELADNAEQVAAQAISAMVEDPPEPLMDAKVKSEPSSSDASATSSDDDGRGPPTSPGDEEVHPAVRRPWKRRAFKSRRRKRRRRSAAPCSRASSGSIPPLGMSSGSDKEPCAEELEAHAKWKAKMKRRNEEKRD
jgi:hypothetical protein